MFAKPGTVQAPKACSSKLGHSFRRKSILGTKVSQIATHIIHGPTKTTGRNKELVLRPQYAERGSNRASVTSSDSKLGEGKVIAVKEKAPLVANSMADLRTRCERWVGE
jgi:hypothetical protein